VRVLEDPLTNKGTAFSEEERSALGLRGLLPAVVETLEQQVRRRYQAYQEQPTDVARHINLRALQDTNEVLFYGWCPTTSRSCCRSCTPRRRTNVTAGDAVGRPAAAKQAKMSATAARTSASSRPVWPVQRRAGRAPGLAGRAARPELNPGHDGDGYQQPGGEQEVHREADDG
jgi:hypothetical protein